MAVNDEWLLIAQQDLHAVDLYSLDGTGITPVRRLGGYGTESGQMNLPEYAAMTKSGTIWVADSGNKRMQLLSLEGEALRVIGRTPSGKRFGRLGMFDFAPDGTLFVPDVDLGLIHHFNGDGTYLGSWSVANNLNGPWALSVSPTGDFIYVIGAFSPMVHRYTSDGRLVGSFQEWRTHGRVHRLVNPTALDVDPETRSLIVVDEALGTVIQVSELLEYESDWGHGHGTAIGGLYNPQGVAIAHGHVWLVDYGNHRVQRFTREGHPEGVFAEGLIGHRGVELPIESKSVPWIAALFPIIAGALFLVFRVYESRANARGASPEEGDWALISGRDN